MDQWCEEQDIKKAHSQSVLSKCDTETPIRWQLGDRKLNGNCGFVEYIQDDDRIFINSVD
jgi:hypothetical protein